MKTRHTKTDGRVTIAQDYEYHLKKMGGRWLLTSIVYVFADGKVDGL